MTTPTTTNTQAATLTHAVRILDSAIHSLMQIRHSIGMSGDRINHHALWQVVSECNQVRNVLIESGASLPSANAFAVFGDTDPATLDTPEARRLLAALALVQELAEVVDAQRGHVLPERIPTGSMESRGTDIADSISHIRIRLSMELNPPKGRGE